MTPAVARAVEDALGRAVVSSSPLSGGCVGDVVRAVLADGESVVVKTESGGGGRLDVEGRMLARLADDTELPVPHVLHARPDLLVMEWIEAGDALGDEAERDAARHLAALHAITAESFGHDEDTLIGGLVQPNPWTDSWRAFFAEHRLLDMARRGHEAGRLPSGALAGVERVANRIDRLLDDEARPALIHGDCWGGNVLVSGGKVAAFIDPAIYFADPEIELAFTTLFGTFGRSFFDAYDELSPLRPGFFEERRDLYNLYPLLVHVRLFGGSYVAQVEATVRRFS